MLLILINWIYCFFICLGIGSFANSFLFQKNLNLFQQVLMGLFFQMLLTHFVAFFLPINFTFYCLNTIIASLGVCINFNSLKTVLKKSIQTLKKWSFQNKILLILLSLIILMQSATAPFTVDNETYYVQTIKWLNEYGFVKGLGNLHLLLGQMSGWHILQSSFNFGFHSDCLNDLNGFLMLLFSVYFLHHFNKYFKTFKPEDLFLGLLPVCNIIFFQFINSPSPDLPVFLIFQLVIYLFYTNFYEYKNDILFLFALCLFLVLIKATVIPILLLPIILIVKHQLFKKEMQSVFVLGLISFLLFTLKNYIVTGFVLFPTHLFESYFNPDWKIPIELQSLFYQKKAAFPQIKPSEFENISILELIKIWFNSPGLKGFFNKLIIILLFIFPFLLKKKNYGGFMRFVGYNLLLFLLLLLNIDFSYL